MFDMETSPNPLDKSRSAIAILALAIGIAILAGCGGSAGQSSSTEELAKPAQTERSKPAARPEQHKPPTNSINGNFSATPGNGYTLDVSYDLRQFEVEVDIANASPGEAILNPIVNGQLTFTNTTPQRNLEFALGEPPLIKLYWKRTQLPSSTRTQLGCEGLQVNGADHCLLFDIFGDIDHLITSAGAFIRLEPNGEDSISLEPSPLGETVVPEQDAHVLAEIIRSTLPSLVLLRVQGLEPRIDTCGWVDYTAALTGSGEVLTDGGDLESC